MVFLIAIAIRLGAMKQAKTINTASIPNSFDHQSSRVVFADLLLGAQIFALAECMLHEEMQTVNISARMHISLCLSSKQGK